jgi:hypothetical protein
MYARALVKIVESHPDNNNICSEALRGKASQLSLGEKRNEWASGTGTWQKIYLF